MTTNAEGSPDLARHVAASTGLTEATAARVVADVAAFFGETVEQFVQRRHEELHRRQLTNEQIWPVIGAELSARRFAAPNLSERQLRRIVYKRPLSERRPAATMRER